MTPNVDNFFLYEIRIFTFFLNVLIMTPTLKKNVVLIMTPNLNNFFLFELPIFTFF